VVSWIVLLLLTALQSFSATCWTLASKIETTVRLNLSDKTKAAGFSVSPFCFGVRRPVAGFQKYLHQKAA
jgi:hypothetical protein